MDFSVMTFALPKLNVVLLLAAAALWLYRRDCSHCSEVINNWVLTVVLTWTRSFARSSQESWFSKTSAQLDFSRTNCMVRVSHTKPPLGQSAALFSDTLTHIKQSWFISVLTRFKMWLDIVRQENLNVTFCLCLICKQTFYFLAAVQILLTSVAHVFRNVWL